MSVLTQEYTSFHVFCAALYTLHHCLFPNAWTGASPCCLNAPGLKHKKAEIEKLQAFPSILDYTVKTDKNIFS